MDTITKTKTTITEDTLEFKENGNIVAIRHTVTDISPRTKKRKALCTGVTITSHALIKKVQKGKNFTFATFNALSQCHQFAYLPQDGYDQLMVAFASGNFYDEYAKVREIDQWEAMDDPDFDAKRVILIEWDSNYLYRIDDDMPVSVPQVVGYIGGVTNDC